MRLVQQAGRRVVLTHALTCLAAAGCGGVDIGMDDEVVCNGKSYKMNALVEAFDKWTKVNSTEEKKKVEDDE